MTIVSPPDPASAWFILRIPFASAIPSVLIAFAINTWNQIKENAINSIAPSLIHAIMSFILACAVRNIRSINQFYSHKSMLIHVTKNVEPHMAVVGNPAKIIGKTKDIKLRDGSGRAAYPWVTHFKRGYPESVVTEWMKSEGE